MTSWVREPTSDLIHRWRGSAEWSFGLRILPMIAAMSGLLAFFGVGAEGAGLLLRTLELTLVAAAGFVLGAVLMRLVRRAPWVRRFAWVTWLGLAVLMILPMAVITFAMESWLASPSPPPSAFPEIARMWLALSPIGCLMLALVSSPGRLELPNPPAECARKAFEERLSVKLKGAAIWAVEAQDHYIRVHTSKGQDLILLSLSDALAELDGFVGARTHRSWWVAREAVADVRRTKGRWRLRLPDGREVPVSRSYSRTLRQSGWF